MAPAAPQGKATNGTWASTFPVNQESPADSTLFMKRFLYVTFSQIISSRGLLPNSCFKKRRCDNLRLYVFHTVNPQAYDCADKLKSVCETIDKGYFRELHLNIYDEMGKEDEIIEVYKMGISYGDDKTPPSVTLSTNELGRVKIEYKGKDALKEQTKDLLIRLHAITGKLDELPDTATCSFYIHYNEENTPKGYQARGFNRRPEPFTMAPDAQRLAIGDASTGHHACALEVASVYIHDPVEFEEVISGDISAMQNSIRIDSSLDASLEGNSPTKDINSNVDVTFGDVREVEESANDAKRRSKGASGLADLENAAQKMRIGEKGDIPSASSPEERQPAEKIRSPLKKRQQKKKAGSASPSKVLKNSKVGKRTPGNMGLRGSGKKKTRQ